MELRSAVEHVRQEAGDASSSTVQLEASGSVAVANVQQPWVPSRVSCIALCGA